MSKRDILAASYLFDHFGSGPLEVVAESATRMTFPSGVKVVHEGDDTLDLFFIEKGRILVQRDTPYGLYSLATLYGGDMFGETSFVDHEGRSGDATTAERSEILLLSSSTLQTLMDRDHHLELALYWAFWKSLSRKLRGTNERLKHFFTAGSSPDLTGPEPTTHPSGSFRVDLNTKRDLFSEQKLSAMEINFLASLSKERAYRPGEVLFREGDSGDHMYIVLNGQVMISKNVPGAGEEALAFLERGDFFGEMALIDKRPRSADAKAHQDGAAVLAIPAKVLEGILDMGKVSSLRLLRILCSLVAKRLREVDEKLVGWFILSGGAGFSERDDG